MPEQKYMHMHSGTYSGDAYVSGTLGCTHRWEIHTQQHRFCCQTHEQTEQTAADYTHNRFCAPNIYTHYTFIHQTGFTQSQQR